ncbi:MAG: dTDP-4-dehydrorhamnose 3,5-epimerase family protein [Nitratireductor sp.]
MALLIPKGTAHGFQSLEDDTELIYVHSTRYTPSAEAGLNALDSRLAITWPLPPRNVSDRDVTFPEIDNSFFGIET